MDKLSPSDRLERQIKNVLRIIAGLCFMGAIILALTSYDSRILSAPVAIHSILVWVGAGLATRSAVPFGGLLLFTSFELIRGCLVPLFVQSLGQVDPVYRQLGEYFDALVVLLVGNAFFAGVLGVTAIALVVSRTPTRAASNTGSAGLASIQGSLILIVLGLIGLILRFPTIEAIDGFLQGRYEDLQTAAGGGVLGFIAAVLRPLLPLGLVCWMLARRRMDVTQCFVFCAVLITGYFALGSFGLNRATIIFPVMALFMGMTTWGFRIKASWFWIAGIGSMIGFFVLGNVRSNLYADRIGVAYQPVSTWEAAIQTLLIYGQSPLQSAPAVAAASAANPWSMASLLNSLLSPIPGVSDLLRESTGTAIYNRVLYQNMTTKDQILPSWLETHLSLGVVGPLVLALILAFVFRYFDAARTRSRSFLGAYACSMATIWAAQAGINSLSGVIQGLIYFALVPAVLSLLPAFRRNGPDQRSPSVATEPVQNA